MPMRRALLRLLAFSGLATLVDRALALGPDYAAARARMLREIESDFRATASDTGVSAPSPALRRALGAVPRERFVPPALAADAYDNNPLPIGEGQTISQPFIVALMTELLQLPPGARVLEVGTGSGYQAAILAEMGMRVYSIEIVAPLAERARVGARRGRLRGGRHAHRRRLPGLAGRRAVRRHHRDGGARPRAARAGGAAEARRPHGDPGGAELAVAGTARDPQGARRAHGHAADAARALRAADARALTGAADG